MKGEVIGSIPINGSKSEAIWSHFNGSNFAEVAQLVPARRRLSPFSSIGRTVVS